MKSQQYSIIKDLLITKSSLKSEKLILVLGKDIFDECEKATKSFNKNSGFVYPIDIQTFCNGLLSVMKFPMIDAKHIIHIADDDARRLKMLPNVWENCKKHYQVCVDSHMENYLKEFAREDPQHYQRFKDVIRDKEMGWVEANFKFDVFVNTLLMVLINNFTEEDEQNLVDWITDYFAKPTSITNR